MGIMPVNSLFQSEVFQRSKTGMENRWGAGTSFTVQVNTAVWAEPLARIFAN
jgi:hypothetical protein